MLKYYKTTYYSNILIIAYLKYYFVFLYNR